MATRERGTKGGRVPFSTHLRRDLRDRLNSLAKRERRTVVVLVEEAIEALLRKREGKREK